MFHANQVQQQPGFFLHVNVAELAALAAHGVEQVTELDRTANGTQVRLVVDGALAATIVSIDGAQAGLEVLQLPQPPDTVDHGVVEVEGRVSGRGVDVLVEEEPKKLAKHAPEQIKTQR